MRRTIALTIALMSTVTALTVVSPAAHADNTKCPRNRFCLFEHVNFGGKRAVFGWTDRNLVNNEWPRSTRTVNNRASSMINNMGVPVILKDIDHSCRGRDYTARRESEDRSFSNNSFNDKASCLIVVR
ncbi:peptidase inhibitor family I36 protein [Spirillospora sp. NBC_00431]